MKLSKSDYVLGVKCTTALAIKKLRPEIRPKMNDAVLERGTAVGELACDRFPGGVRVTDAPWTDAARRATAAAIAANAPAIFEATFATPTGEYCAVDVLRNNGDGTWDIIEVKSTTRPHEYHYLDVSFQRYVLLACAVAVRGCYIMTLNGDYVRRGTLDLNELFTLTDATAQLQDVATVSREVARLRAFLDVPDLGIAISKAKCTRFYDCGYMHHCWADVPEYSVFDAFRAPDADRIYARYGARLENLPTDVLARQLHPGDIESFLSGRDVVDAGALREFLGELKYPLYFLDYESIQPAVPMFDASRPYQQICFQFSLHVLDAPGAAVRHYEYLHDDPNTDPRPGLVRRLIECCGDAGSVIVYNRAFEQGRNTEMARDFPEFAASLNAINARMVDLLTPFRTRALYRPSQHGRASIKQTLPAFVPSMTYDNLGIHNGAQASDMFMDFMRRAQDADTTARMMRDLREYCGRDTWAMVELLRVVENYAGTPGDKNGGNEK